MFNKDKIARKAIKDLCHRLGISYGENGWEGEGIQIGKYNCIDGGNPEKIPLTSEDLRMIKKNIYQLDNNLRLLLDFLGLYIFEGKKIEKTKK